MVSCEMGGCQGIFGMGVAFFEKGGMVNKLKVMFVNYKWRNQGYRDNDHWWGLAAIIIIIITMVIGVVKLVE
jgi:hypothetical protein